jgi:hypothetical protein
LAYFEAWAADPDLIAAAGLPASAQEAFGLTAIGLVIGMFVISVATFLVARRMADHGRPASRLGLAYGVAMALGISLVETQVPITEPIFRGGPTAAYWVLFFPLVIPAPPREAVAAALVAATMVPGSMFVWAAFGVPLPAFLPAFSWSYMAFLVAIVSYVPKRVMAGLRVRATRAEAQVRTMGSYVLVEELGSGGMGEVWRATHQMLARPAAIKIIRHDRLQTLNDNTIVARFEREAQVTSTLQSPHTVELYDFGISRDGAIFYVMELLVGIDLHGMVERYGPVPPERAAHLLIQACRSLNEAHMRGLVHRDIKPANLHVGPFATEPDFLKVLDFGLVRLTDLQGEPSPELTDVGTVTGTPAYMAPEVALGEVVDHRADIYALGCVGWWLLTGGLVFEKEGHFKTLRAHVEEPPDAAALATHFPIPAPLVSIIMRCLEKLPDKRFASARDLASSLAAVTFESKWTEQRAGRWWDLHAPDIALKPIANPAANGQAETLPGFAGTAS